MLDEKESLVTVVARVRLCLECMVSVFAKGGSGGSEMFQPHRLVFFVVF